MCCRLRKTSEAFEGFGSFVVFKSSLKYSALVFLTANQKGLPNLPISSHFASGRHDPAEFRRLTDRIQVRVAVHKIEPEASFEAVSEQLESAKPILRILPRGQRVDASH